MGYLCGGTLARNEHLLVEVLVKHLQWRVGHHHLVLVHLDRERKVREGLCCVCVIVVYVRLGKVCVVLLCFLLG